MIALSAPFPVEISFCTTRIVRVRLGGQPACVASYLPPHAWAEVVHRQQDGRLETDAMTVSVTVDDVTFLNRSGAALLRIALDETQLHPRLLMRLQLFGEQHFYGLGEGGPQFDRLGAVRRFWNFQVNRGQGADVVIPLLLSHLGYGVFFDSSAAATLEPAEAGDGAWLEYRGDPGPLDLYFLGATTLRGVLGDVAQLLGRATLPPRWALGYMQSSRHFVDTDELRDLAAQFRARQLPCDALIFLSSYGTARGWNRGVGHLEFEPELFAGAAEVLQSFRDQHFQIITHEYPVLHDNSPLAAEANQNGYRLETTYLHLLPQQPQAPVYKDGQHLIDFSQAAARRWWWQAHDELRALGVSGWWLDGGEGPPATETLKEGPARVLHNRFDLLRQQAFAEGEATDRSDMRPFMLCRSGGPGMQRFGAIPWSGDINATFTSLEQQIRIGLNLGMSGVPHWGTDTGGFYRVGEADPDLFVRWFQFSTFCSIFRGHGHMWRQHLPWSHGERVEAICRRYMELRSRLMPYTYTLAWQARQLGLPMMRPLVLNYPDDPNVWDLGGQYLWGDDILVAPVTRKGATQWTVYLPKGTWYDFWTREAFHGPDGITVDAQLDTLPLFVRAGAIIPTGPIKQYDTEEIASEITVMVYPNQASTFVLYEDDGISNAYLRGDYTLIKLSCEADDFGCVCRVSSQIDRAYTFLLAAPQIPAGAKIGVGNRSTDGARWMDDSGLLKTRLTAKVGAIHVTW